MTRPCFERFLKRGLVLGIVATACLTVAWCLSRPGLGQEEAAGVGAGGSLLRTAPFDRLTLSDGTVIDVEPLSPRPLPVYDPPGKEKNRKSGTGFQPPPEGNILLP